MELYFLEFSHGLHLARGVEDLASVEALPRSDTITAALLSVWPQIDPAADVGRLAAAPPFRVSSGLPARRTRRGVEWFLPAPLGLFGRGRRDPALRTQWKRIQWLAPASAERALRGELPPAEPSRLLQGGAIWPEHEPGPGEPRELFASEETTRVAVDRLSGSAAEGRLFAFARTRFAVDAGVALLAEALDPALGSTLRRVLVALGAEGLGGERSAGLGEFRVDGPHPVRLPALGSGGRLLLSLAAPPREAVDAGLLDPPARYRLVERGGWVTRPGAASLRRRTVRMLAEGSIVRATASDPGRAVRVLEPLPALGLGHPIWRGGPALALDIAPEAGA